MNFKAFYNFLAVVSVLALLTGACANEPARLPYPLCERDSLADDIYIDDIRLVAGR